ncbi:hypothetical protein KFE25_001317 [Diacronema lutheri]|uniref:WD repeat-containing protein 54 beta-propeller domain-containing protein n=1 Tax=Diacronema lutheri TaxID=2081491 RepID=A0A8J5XCE2_DIALT|nr:hypothetical protein KFE25_001317 [Diacronema lutheri]
MSTRQIDVSASMLPNNLASNGKLLAFASLSRVPIITEEHATPATIATIDAPNGTLVMQCGWCTFGQGPSFLVLALKTGVQVWGAEGKRMLLWAPLPALIAKEVAAAPPDPDQHAMGIAALSTGGAYRLCVGTSVGTVLVFSHDALQTTFAHALSVRAKPVEQPEPAVTALAAAPLASGSGALLARADGTGAVQLWTTADGHAFERGRRLAADGLSCTGVCARADVVLCAFSNGELRGYGAHSGHTLVAIAAHARAINALALHPTLWLLAAAAEDTYVSVWSIALPGAGGSGEMGVKNVAFWGVADAHLCGVAFHGEGGKRVSASAYDSTALTTWTLP